MLDAMLSSGLYAACTLYIELRLCRVCVWTVWPVQRRPRRALKRVPQPPIEAGERESERASEIERERESDVRDSGG